MKLFTALGPGDIVAAHRAQLSGDATAGETSIIFSGQVVEFCQAQGIELLALSCNQRRDTIQDGRSQLENRPRWCEKCSGVRYHLSRIWYAVYLAMRAWRFGADLAVIDSGTAHYFAFALFGFFQIPVAINFHNTLWPNGFEPKGRIARLILALDAWFFRHVTFATAGVSPECGRQVRQLAGSQVPYLEYRTQYRCEEFQFRRADSDRNPFRVIYVGRIERNKGVFDIAAIAQSLRGRSRGRISFDLCGHGGALQELRAIVAKQGLDDVVHVHGRVPRSKLFELLERAHAVIVPTRSDFCEGLPAVCAEAVLCGLPIVTSRLSNAIPLLSPAIMEAEPENIESFANAVLRLAEDRDEYDELSRACPGLAQQFCDRSQSYPAALDRLISTRFPQWRRLTSYDAVFARLGRCTQGSPITATEGEHESGRIR